MAIDIKRQAQRLLDDGFSKGNLNVFDEVCSPQVKVTMPPLGQVDLAGMKEFVRAQRSAFPDMKFTVDEAILSGETVVLRWSCTATHQGEFMGIPATNKKGTTSGISISRFSGEKLVDHFALYDLLGVLQQIGAAPVQPGLPQAKAERPEARH